MPIDVVCAPIWDVEGTAFLGGGVSARHGSPDDDALYLETNPSGGNGTVTSWKDFAEPVLALETRLMLEERSANCSEHRDCQRGRAQVLIHLDPGEADRRSPFGLEDWAKSQTPSTIKKPAGAIFACFIGRLELRKRESTYF